MTTTYVLATLWGAWLDDEPDDEPDDELTAASASAIEDQAHECAGLALARETPGAIEVRTCVLSQTRLVNNQARHGYCITAAVGVERDIVSLNDELALVKQAQDSLAAALRQVFHLVLIEDGGILSRPSVETDAPNSPERRG